MKQQEILAVQSLEPQDILIRGHTHIVIDGENNEYNPGGWVDKGDVIARFFHVGVGAHIHFAVTMENAFLNPEPFFGGADRTELLSLIHSYHPGWNISYPAS